MGDFDSCGLWTKLAYLTTDVGFVLDLFGMAMSDSSSGAYIGRGNGGKDVDGLLVAGFLFFLAAAALLSTIVHLDDMSSSKIARICFIILAFFAGKLIMSLIEFSYHR